MSRDCLRIYLHAWLKNARLRRILFPHDLYEDPVGQFSLKQVDDPAFHIAFEHLARSLRRLWLPS